MNPEIREISKPEHKSDFLTDQILKIYFYSEHLFDQVSNTSEWNEIAQNFKLCYELHTKTRHQGLH